MIPPSPLSTKTWSKDKYRHKTVTQVSRLTPIQLRSLRLPTNQFQTMTSTPTKVHSFKILCLKYITTRSDQINNSSMVFLTTISARATKLDTKMKYSPTTYRVTTTLFNRTSLSDISSLNIDQKVHVVPRQQSWVYKIHKKVEVIPSTKFTLKAARKFTKILTGKTLICNSYSSLIKKCYTTKVTKQ